MLSAYTIPIILTPVNAVMLAGRFAQMLSDHQIGERALHAEDISPEGMDIIFGILRMGGFKPHRLVPCLSRPTSPFAVVGANDRELVWATGWLECAFKRVRDHSLLSQRDRPELIKELASEIERSVPLRPIELAAGFILAETPPALAAGNYPYFVSHTQEDDQLQQAVGIHPGCGDLKWYILSSPHHCVSCLHCHRGIRVPREHLVPDRTTYRALREYLIENPGGAKKP